MRLAPVFAALLLVGVVGSVEARADDDDHHRYGYGYSRSRNYYRGSLAPANPPRRSNANSCWEGTVIGGLAGAGVGAAVTKGDSRWIGVPIGAAAGALVGCQVDGG
jgi:outer membrane lipoprotein SlyB